MGSVVEGVCRRKIDGLMMGKAGKLSLSAGVFMLIYVTCECCHGDF